MAETKKEKKKKPASTEIKFVPLDAAHAGVEEQFQACLTDVVMALNEQELGERLAGKVKVVITVVFDRQQEGATVSTSSKVTLPARMAGAGAFAHIVKGGLLVSDAEQMSLGLEGPGSYSPQEEK